MAILTKKQVALIGLLIGIGLLTYLSGGRNRPGSPIKFISILPSTVNVKQGTGSLTFRKDYFAVMNLDRSDSATLLKAVAQHACRVVDTINLKKYQNYRLEYYEHGIYMNDSTMRHSNLRREGQEMYQVASEIDAFVYWIIYHEGKLNTVRWYRDGSGREEKEIKVTNEVRQLFTNCHERK